MGKFFLSLVLLIISLNVSADEVQQTKQVIDASIEEAVLDLDLTLPLESNILKFKTGVFLSEKVSQKIINALENSGEYLGGPTTDIQNKSFYLISMNIGDEDITEALIRAKNAGAKRVALVVDGDSGLILKKQFATQDSILINQWEQVEFKSGAMGRELEKLKNAGFTLNNIDSPYGIYMQPLLVGEDHLRPLQHEKGLIISFDKVIEPPQANQSSPLMHKSQRGQDFRVEVYRLTDNFTDRGESTDEVGGKIFLSAYNRGFSIAQREIALFELRHIESLMEILAQGKTIYHTPGQKSFTLEFNGGSLIEVAYTKGKHNPNDRMLEWIERAKKYAHGESLVEVVASHFAFSHDRVAESLVEFLNDQAKSTSQIKTKLFIISDDNFIDPYKYGLPSLFVGYTNKIGDNYNNGLIPEAQKQVEAYSYIKHKNPIKKILKPLKGSMLWHDKTTLFVFEDWTIIFTGSFNLSDRSPNGEYQYMFKVPTKSDFAKAYVASIKNPVQERPDLFMELDEAVFRTRLSRFLGVSVGEISLQNVRTFIKYIRKNNFDELVNLGVKIRQDVSPSNMKFSEEEYFERIEKMKRLLAWYRYEIVEKNKNYVSFVESVMDYLGQSPSISHQQVALFTSIVEKPPTKKSSINGFVTSLLGYSKLPLDKDFKDSVVESFKNHLKEKHNRELCVDVFL